jgi:hypothetical protein
VLDHNGEAFAGVVGEGEARGVAAPEEGVRALFGGQELGGGVLDRPTGLACERGGYRQAQREAFVVGAEVGGVDLRRAVGREVEREPGAAG